MMIKYYLFSPAKFNRYSHFFISWLIFVSLILIAVAPVGAGILQGSLDQKSPNLIQPTDIKTESLPVITTPEYTGDDGDISPPDSKDSIPPDEIETPTIGTGAEPEDPDMIKEISTTSTTQTTTTSEEGLVTNSGTTELTDLTPDTPNDQEDCSQAIPQQKLLITTSTEVTTETHVSNINVITSQTYIDVSAQISITDLKPLNSPSISFENQNNFIQSYITIHLLADNVALSDGEIESMTMTLKIKKTSHNQTSAANNQIYVLTYETNPAFSLSHPFISQIVSPHISGVWEPITPVEITEDEEFFYYHMETLSFFSTFAIVGTELIEIQPYHSGIPEIPWGVIIATIILASVLLLIVLFKTGFVYQLEESSDTKNKEKIFKGTNQKWSYKIKLSTTPPELHMIRSPTLYFAANPHPPQIITASTNVQQISEEPDSDPMYL